MAELNRPADPTKTFYRDLVLFGLVGVVSTVADIAVLNIFYIGFQTSIYVATLLGFLVGSVNGYLMNNQWTYQRLGKKAQLSALAQYSIVGAVGLGLTEIIMHLLTVQSGLNYNVSKLIAVLVVFFWNFFGNRYWTFRTQA